MTKKVIIFGTGLFAKYANYFIENFSKGMFSVSAFTVEKSHIESKELLGKIITPFEELEALYSPKEYDMFVAIGPSKKYGLLNGLRADFCKQCRNKGYKLINYIHPSSNIYPKAIHGDNVFIGPLNNIDPFTKIGENAVLWTQNHIGHESEIGKDTFITSGVTISGSCKIGSNCYFGVNSSTADGVTLGNNTFVGMGVTITSSTESGSVYKPEKIIPKEYKTEEMRGF